MLFRSLLSNVALFLTLCFYVVLSTVALLADRPLFTTQWDSFTEVCTDSLPELQLAQVQARNAVDNLIEAGATPGEVALLQNLLKAAKDREAKEREERAKGHVAFASSDALEAGKNLVVEAPWELQLAKEMGTAAGQLALLKAVQAWLLSPQGVEALEHTAKIIELLYDVDQAEEEVLMAFWRDIQEIGRAHV